MGDHGQGAGAGADVGVGDAVRCARRGRGRLLPLADMRDGNGTVLARDPGTQRQTGQDILRGTEADADLCEIHGRL